MSSPTFILITGANRGIGRALVSHYLQRPNNTVIATVRDPTSSTSQTLPTLPTHQTSKLITLTLESSSEASTQAAISTLQTTHHIPRLDLVIANAGIGTWAPITQTRVSDLQQHFLINSIGPLLLFQSVLPLLQQRGAAADADTNNNTTNAPPPRFVPISSILGSIAYIDKAPLPDAAYGASKAALNFLTRKIHQEHGDVTAFAVHPGWIDTPLGNASARFAGLESAPDRLGEDGDGGKNVEGMVKLFDDATREKNSGRFFSYDGVELPW